MLPRRCGGTAFSEDFGWVLSRYRVDFDFVKIAVRNINASRLVEVDSSILTTNPEEVVNHPDVDIVLELMGGEEPARTYVLQALNNGKSVVTANKALIAEFGPELFAAAATNGTRIFFEASVAGGIPIIKALNEGLSANSFESIHGILNGTCNYILSRMEDGVTFEKALVEAQELGYAEADPTDSSSNESTGVGASGEILDTEPQIKWSIMRSPMTSIFGVFRDWIKLTISLFIHWIHGCNS